MSHCCCCCKWTRQFTSPRCDSQIYRSRQKRGFHPRKGTRYFTSKELWIKSKTWCLHWLHRRLIIPQNVAALQNGRLERGFHRNVLPATSRSPISSVDMPLLSCHYHSILVCSSSDNIKETSHSNEDTQFHCFTVHFNSLYIMVQLMHLFVIKH
jgi:hypothetical protein